jgi:hypothetical protein
MSEHILTRKHKHHTHPQAAFGWRIHCGVEVTELSTNKQHTLSIIEYEQILFLLFSCSSWFKRPRVVVDYCRTYETAVSGGGRRTVEDMCCSIRRASACVN